MRLVREEAESFWYDFLMGLHPLRQVAAETYRSRFYNGYLFIHHSVHRDMHENDIDISPSMPRASGSVLDNVIVYASSKQQSASSKQPSAISNQAGRDRTASLH